MPILWFEQRVTVNSEISSGLRQVFIIPNIGYAVLGAIIAVGVIMMLWFPIGTLLCSTWFKSTNKQVPTAAHCHDSNGQDVESPLMFKKHGPGQQKKNVEMQPMTNTYSNDIKSSSTGGDERYS